MTLEYRYDASTDVIHVVGYGAVTMQERLAFLHDLHDDPALPGSAAVMVEVSGISNPPAAEDMGALSLMVERLHRRFRGRTAIVNSRVGHATISCMVAMSVPGGEEWLRVFLSHADAVRWLTM